MTINFTVPFQTAVYWEVPVSTLLFKTDILWQPILPELAQFTSGKAAVYSLPEDIANAKLYYNKQIEEQNTSILKGITSQGYLEPTKSVCIPFPSTSFDKIEDEQKQRLIDLAKQFNVEIIISQRPIYNQIDDNAEIDKIFFTILGKVSHVEACTLHLKVLMDLFQNKKFIEYLEFDSYSLLPLCTGIDQSVISNLSKQFHCDIYLPSPIVIPNDLPDILPTVFFSGPIHSLVLALKDKFQKHLNKMKENLYFQRFSNISPLKLLFIKSFYNTKILELMDKFQSFIMITDSFIEFQSPSPTILENVTKAFTIQILHNIVEIQIVMNENFKFNDTFLQKINNINQKEHILTMQFPDLPNQLVLCIDHSNKLAKDITGSENALNNLKNIFNEDSLFPYMKQLRAIFEIHPEFEEFISGKKNGKLTRIMELSGCLIKIEMNEGDENMFLNVISDSYEDFQKGFTCFIDELPAESAFFIPEVYHRPVIGAGGSVIQTTMKKHNVFIQFSNSFALPQNNITHVRYDNVIIRCPYKNINGIEMAKNELRQLTNECSLTQCRTLIKFSPGQYRFILENSNDLIAQIEKNMNVYIVFPTEEPADGYELEIRGSKDSSIVAAQKYVNTCFGKEKEIYLDTKLDLDNIEIFSKWNDELVIPLKYSFNIEVQLTPSMIRLTYRKDNNKITQILDIVSEYLSKQKISITEKRNIDDFILKTDTPVKSLEQDSPLSDESIDLHKNDYQNYIQNNVNNNYTKSTSFASPTKNRNYLNSNTSNTRSKTNSNNDNNNTNDFNNKKFNQSQYSYNRYSNGYVYEYDYEDTNPAMFGSYPYGFQNNLNNINRSTR